MKKNTRKFIRKIKYLWRQKLRLRGLFTLPKIERLFTYTIIGKEICKKTGRDVLLVQVRGKNIILKMDPEELIVDDGRLMGFSPLDVRTISTLAIQVIQATDSRKIFFSYKMVGQYTSKDKEQEMIVLQCDNEREMVGTASHFTRDYSLLIKLSPLDTNRIGYTAGYYEAIAEMQPMKRDYFAHQAQHYANYRPHYPLELIGYLATLTPKHAIAWDCGTGNGQVAQLLAKYFLSVIATDISAEQIALAPSYPNVCYQVCNAEKTKIANNSVDLICIGQALHWFNLENFYKEARRVLKSKGVIAAWCYSDTVISDKIDSVIKKFYQAVTMPDIISIQRRYVKDNYQTISFPFNRLKTPIFHMQEKWNLHQLMGYIKTWPAIQDYQYARQQDPLTDLIEELHTAWGEPTLVRNISWPLHLLVGIVDEEE